MIMVEGDISNFENVVIYYICDKGFNDEDWKVRDYCYFLGKFRGVVYNSCYLKFNKLKNIFVIFYNFLGYDVYLLLGGF